MAGNPEIVVDYRADTSGLNKSLKGLSKTGDRIGKSIKAAGVVAAAGLGLVAVAAGKSVKAASDLNESMNAVQVVFGTASKQIFDFGDKAARRAGLSMNELNQAVTPIGATLINAGYSADQAAASALTLTKRAADMASVFNTSVPDALEAVQAGLRGEADPLERYGVGLSDAAVQAEALRLGLKKQNGQLTANEKAQARMSILLKQTNKLSGDFVNTSKGFANAQRIIHAEWENISASIGGALLPVLAKAATGFADFLARFGEAKGAGAKFRVVLDEVTGLATSLFNTLRDAIGRIDWTQVWAQAKGIAEGFSEKAKALGNAIENAVDKVDWAAVGKKIGDALSDAFDFALPKAQAAADRILEIARKIDWVKMGRAMGPGLAAAITVAFTTLTDPSFWLKNWDLALAVGLTAFGDGLGKIAGKLATPLARFGREIVAKIGAAMGPEAGKLAQILLDALLKLPGVITRAGGALGSAVRTLFGRLGGLAVFTVKVLGIQAAIQAIGDFVDKAKNWLADKLPAALKAAAILAATAAFGVGIAIGQGILNGMSSMLPALLSKAEELALKPVNWAKKHLGIGSPSRVWAELGVDTIAGYILGITSEQPHLNAKTSEAMTKALDAARATVEASQERFRATFDRLGDFAGRAFAGRTQTILDKITARFDTMIGKWQGVADALTPAEQQLADISKAEDQRSRDAAKVSAQAALASAETEQQRTDALEQIRQADLAQTIADLQVRAEQERVAQEARAAEQIRALEDQKARELQNAEERRRQAAETLDGQLADLRERLAKHPEEQDKIQKQIVKLLKGYGVDYKQAGEDLGTAFAKGLKASEDAVEKAARSLAQTVAKFLPHSPAEEGPLKRTDFFAGFGQMLATNLLSGAGVLSGAANRLAAGVANPLNGMAPAITGGPGGATYVSVFIGDQELRGLVRSEVVSENNRTAQVLLAGA